MALFIPNVAVLVQCRPNGTILVQFRSNRAVLVHKSPFFSKVDFFPNAKMDRTNYVSPGAGTPVRAPLEGHA